MKKVLTIIVTLAILMNIFSVPVMASTTDQVQVKRLSGNDRYETAIKIANELAGVSGINLSQGDKLQAVILASGNNWPDAITGAPLAREYNAPILLLNTTVKSSNQTFDYMQKHVSKDAKVIILGGTGVVPIEFTEHLEKLGYNAIEQIGGSDRYETSLMIAKKLTNTTKYAYLVSGDNFYDALNASSDASNEKSPILLVSSKQGLNQQQEEYLKTFKMTEIMVPVITVGEIKDATKSFYEKAGVKQNLYAGDNRYATNMTFERYHGRDSRLFVTTGENYPDALTGAVLVGTLGGFLILTEPNGLPQETELGLSELAYFHHNPERWPDESQRFYAYLYVLGGEGAVTSGVESQIVNILNSDGQINPNK
ncbi:MAG: cell wall-binding repeat-containing protein [Clostridia bacterium]